MFPKILLCSVVLLSVNSRPWQSPQTNNGDDFQPSTRDSAIVADKLRIAEQHHTMSARALAVAKSFLGTPYNATILNTAGKEHLVVNLRALDCWTLVENAVAIAQTAREGGNISLFREKLQQLRYWGGAIDGYASRIHYFTGWILQAEKTGVLTDITRSLGGRDYRKKIGYMSARPQKYPALKKTETLQAIRRAEARINAHHWFYIPKANIRQMEAAIQDGDIIMLTSWKADLDIAHEGFAVWQNGRVHLLHASSLNKKVILSNKPLAEYTESQLGQTGIMVARLLD